MRQAQRALARHGWLRAHMVGQVVVVALQIQQTQVRVAVCVCVCVRATR
jgi:hypothetical protein